MSDITPSSLAAATAQGAENVQFQPETASVPRKLLLIGSGPAPVAMPTGWTEDEPKLILSPDEVGAAFGRGTMLHRLAMAAWRGSRGIETWATWQDETNTVSGVPVKAAGVITPTVGAGWAGGTIHLFIAGDYVPVAATVDDDATDIKALIKAAINAKVDLPVTADVVATVLTPTAKDKGLYGNFISISFNLDYGQSLPAGLSMVVTPMSGGLGVGNIADALASLGAGDLANERYLTDMVHGYGQETAILDAITSYVGNAQTDTGTWNRLVARPFRALTGDTVADAAGLAGLIALADTRRTDMANGVVAAPGSPTHPSEVAAVAMGYMARINNLRAAQSYVDAVLEGVRSSYGMYPLSANGQWTDQYANRDIAVKNGLGTTLVKNGVVTLQNAVTFYRPDAIPVTSNGWRSMRNISILQNVLFTHKQNFAQEKWKGISIVADVRRVTNPTDRAKARSVQSVKDDLLALINAMASRAWIYDTAFPISELKKSGSVVIRAGGTGFDYTQRVILSGEGGILNGTVQFDISIAVTLATA